MLSIKQKNKYVTVPFGISCQELIWHSEIQAEESLITPVCMCICILELVKQVNTQYKLWLITDKTWLSLLAHMLTE